MTSAAARRRRLATRAEWAALALAFLALAWLCLRAGGLRDPLVATPLALLSALPLAVAARAWRLPWWSQLAAAALPVSLAVVAVAHADPTGGARIGRYAYFAVLLLGVAAFARTPRRRLLVAAGLGAVGVVLSLSGIAGMLRTGDAGRFLDGGMWPNTFGAAMALTAAVGMGIALLTVPGRRAWAHLEVLVAVALGWLAAVLGIAGTVMSGSRASLALLGLAALLLLPFTARVRGWRGGARWLLLLVLGGVVAVLLRLPVLLPALVRGGVDALGSASGGASVNPVAALAKPGLARSWDERLEFWRIAWQMGLDHPVVGAGLSRFGSPLQLCYQPRATASDPHSELLRAWADGGLVAVLPVLAAFLAAALVVVVALRALRGPAPRLAADPGRWAASAGVGVAAAHLAIDFDWAYPAMLGLAALLGGVAAAPLLRHRPGHRQPITSAILGIVILLIMVTVGLVGGWLDPSAADPLAMTALAGDTVDCG